MSTHNIGFYEEISKIIPELSNIIKYAPYLFFWCLQRRAGIREGGVGQHVNLPMAWTELAQLAQCRGKIQEGKDNTNCTYIAVMNLCFRTHVSWHTVQIQIRLLLEEQSDQGLHCLLFNLHLFDKIPKGLASFL